MGKEPIFHTVIHNSIPENNTQFFKNENPISHMEIVNINGKLKLKKKTTLQFLHAT